MAPRNPNNHDLSSDILSNFITDDEDDQQLGNDSQVDDDDDDDDLSSTDDRGGNDDNDDSNDDDDDNDSQQPQQRRATGDVDDDEGSKQDRFSFKEDRAGNFVDRDGKIIIRAGKQRDLFVKLKKRWLAEEKQRKELTGRFSETVRAAQQLLERYKAIKAERTEFDNRGLSKDEIRTAADMAVLMRVDPKAAIRKLLTMAHMNGTDLKDIGITGPVDAAEVARIIEQRSKPKEETEEEKVRKEANAFLTRHPAAQQYTGVIAEAKRRYPHMSLDEIWFQLVMHAQNRQKKTANGRSDSNDRQRPDRVSPNNGSPRDDDRRQRQQSNKKLSLNAVDPSQSFSQIGRDLLRDLKDIEGR